MHRTLLDGIPTTLQIGSTMTPARTSTYATLLSAGVLPALRPRADEPSLSYLKRCGDALAKQHPNNAFTLTLAPYHASESENSDAGLELRDPVTAVFYPSDHEAIDARAFERAAIKADRRISTALMRELALASCFSLNAFTAASAFDAAEFMYFDGDLRMWWDEIKYAAAHDLGIKESAITGLQLRRYLRTNEIRTPGQLKRQIGAHHAPSRGWRTKKKNPLRARQLPRKLATFVDSASALIKRLKSISGALKRSLREDDYSVLQSFSSFAHPALIVETSEHGAVGELIDDLYQQQDSNFGPSFAMILDGTPSSAKCLARVIDLLTEASTISERLRELFAAFR